MGRPPTVRWKQSISAWVAEVGDPWTDSKGRKRRREVRFPFGRTERERALSAMLAYRAESAKRESDPASILTVRDISLAYLTHAKMTLSRRTYQGHIECLRRFCAEGRGDRLARDLDASDLSGFRDRLLASGYSPNYTARIIRSIKACWAWASAPDANRSIRILLESNPFASVRPPRIPRSPERFAPESEVRAFLGFLRGRIRSRDLGPLTRSFDRSLFRLIAFIARTGCRPDEAARAEWSHLSWERRTLTLRGKTSAKTGRARVIFLSPPIMRMIRRIHAMNQNDRFIFVHKRGRGSESRGASDPRKGEPWRDKALQHRVRQLVREAIEQGVPLEIEGSNRFTLYRLRHTSISKRLMRGESIHDVAAIHGTSVREIERTYGHLLIDHLRHIADRSE